MIAGKLDRRITIQRLGTPTDDGFTTSPGALANYAVRWASWKPSTGREGPENMGREAYASGSFHVRRDTLTADLNETDVVLFSGKVWNITSLMEIGRGDGVEIAVVAKDQ